MTWRRGDVLLAVAAIVVAGICVAAGVWQLDRLAQRRARNADLEARLARPPLELGSAGTIAPPADSAHRRRVTARGVYDYDREWVRPGRSFQGTPGVALLTPLRFADGSVVLVDRGWVPSPDAFHIEREPLREGDTTVTITGLALAAPRGPRDVNPRTLRDSLPYALLPFVIQQTAPPAATASGLPRRWPPPTLSNGPHLFYAIQWFSFALVALVGTAVLLRKSSRTGELSR
ncbi:MAG: SURF1 family protein [Gemmatimonadales bacterium]